MTSYASFDFHLHSVWSYDAEAPVGGYFERAAERSVKYIALTEHNCVDSYPEVCEHAVRRPEIGYIKGAELAVDTPMGTLELLCLGLPEKNTPALQNIFDRYRRWQQDFGDAFSALLGLAGIPYDREARRKLLLRYRPEKVLALQGVTHVKSCLQTDYLVNEKRYFADPETLGNAVSGHLRAQYPDYSEILPAVRASGAVILLAHPAKLFNGNDLRRMDALLECLRFDGIECAHDLIPPELTPFYRHYCIRRRLLSSAGSDNHSFPDSRYRFGAQHEFARHLGEDAWCEEILERVAVYHGTRTTGGNE